MEDLTWDYLDGLVETDPLKLRDIAFELASQRQRDGAANTPSAAALPPAWSDLLKGLTLLAKHQNNLISPFHCTHDQLTVMADPTAFTDDEIERLDTLGFSADAGQECFYSFRFGSA